MTKVSVRDLSDGTKDYIAKKVEAGEYGSPEAVVDAGIDLLQRMEQMDDALRREIDIGLEAAKEGRFGTRSIPEIIRDKKKELGL